jgi:hypothetical protein
MDGDGDVDAVVGQPDGTLYYFRNEGTPTSAGKGFEVNDVVTVLPDGKVQWWPVSMGTPPATPPTTTVFWIRHNVVEAGGPGNYAFAENGGSNQATTVESVVEDIVTVKFTKTLNNAAAAAGGVQALTFGTSGCGPGCGGGTVTNFGLLKGVQVTQASTGAAGTVQATTSVTLSMSR